MMKTLQGWIDKSTAPSPIEIEATNRYNTNRNWLDKKDYRTVDAGVDIPMLNLGDYQKMQKFGQAPTSGPLAENQKNQNTLSADELNQNYGENYEQQVGNLAGQNQSLAQTLQGLYSDRMNAGVSGSQSQLQNIINRPKGFDWMRLLQMGASALPGVLSGIGSMGSSSGSYAAPAFQFGSTPGLSQLPGM